MKYDHSEKVVKIRVTGKWSDTHTTFLDYYALKEVVNPHRISKYRLISPWVEEKKQMLSTTGSFIKDNATLLRTQSFTLKHLIMTPETKFRDHLGEVLLLRVVEGLLSTLRRLGNQRGIQVVHLYSAISDHRQG